MQKNTTWNIKRTRNRILSCSKWQSLYPTWINSCTGKQFPFIQWHWVDPHMNSTLDEEGVNLVVPLFTNRYGKEQLRADCPLVTLLSKANYTSLKDELCKQCWVLKTNNFKKHLLYHHHSKNHYLQNDGMRMSCPANTIRLLKPDPFDITSYDSTSSGLPTILHTRQSKYISSFTNME